MMSCFLKEQNGLPVGLSLHFDMLCLQGGDNLNCFTVFNLSQ